MKERTSEASEASFTPEPLVQDSAALAVLCDRLRGEPWIALDTEFMRTKTYRASLCLIQAATPGVIACIDPLAISGREQLPRMPEAAIGPLLDLIYSPNVLKVFHSARQDLEVLADLRGAPPAPVFDTQIAAALAGYDDQIGYGALVESITGHKLPKLHTRADWEARPLAPELLHYAEDDVRYLRDVYLFLAQKLEALGRREWLTEECAALTDAALYRNNPREAWRRLRQGQRLPPKAQVILRELAAWRESAAQSSNLPRSWVVADAALVEMALTAPANLEQLGGIEGIGGGATRKWGDNILEAIRRGQAAAPERLWEEPTRPDREEQARYQRIQARVQAVAAEQGIKPTLLASRKDIQRLLEEPPSGPLTSGWRRRLFGDELLQLRAVVSD